MAVWQMLSWIIFLLTAAAYPEIPSKGKHTRVQDAQQTPVEDVDMPRFAEPIANVTVSIGRDALLACVVENLKGYKVAWVRVDTQTILSIHHNVISQNNRISLTYNDHRSWYLHIKEVEESDRGWYMCQVNTDPMRSRKGYLQVVVPPMIVEGMTSNDMVVREGLNVTLMCKARGYPEPYVMWRREDGEEMLIGGEQVNVVDGELLHITKVSRLHMAAYLCVASNGVPPSISKRVHLRVQFPPMLSIPNQLEGAYVGQDVILACHTEAYPASINYWTTERGDMIISDTSRAGDKFETTSTVSGYSKYMKLKIRSVGANDFGTYRCVAKNSLGETDGNIKLDEMPTPTTAIISEMALLNRSLDGRRRNRNKFDLNTLPDYGVEEWRDGAGNGAGSGGAGDNNQTPVRNPPGAFHNAAGALAQRNLLGSIIQRIRKQSLGMLERLTRQAAAVLERMRRRCGWEGAVSSERVAVKGKQQGAWETAQAEGVEKLEADEKQTQNEWMEQKNVQLPDHFEKKEEAREALNENEHKEDMQEEEQNELGNGGVRSFSGSVSRLNYCLLPLKPMKNMATMADSKAGIVAVNTRQAIVNNGGSKHNNSNIYTPNRLRQSDNNKNNNNIDKSYANDNQHIDSCRGRDGDSDRFSNMQNNNHKSNNSNNNNNNNCKQTQLKSMPQIISNIFVVLADIMHSSSIGNVTTSNYSMLLPHESLLLPLPLGVLLPLICIVIFYAAAKSNNIFVCFLQHFISNSSTFSISANRLSTATTAKITALLTPPQAAAAAAVIATATTKTTATFEVCRRTSR